MPELPNIKHELYCRYRSVGTIASHAHKSAGFVGTAGAACALEKNPKIAARIEELKERLVEGKIRVAATRASAEAQAFKDNDANLVAYTAELFCNLDFARAYGNPNNTTRTLEMIGSAWGLFKTKPPHKDKHVHKPRTVKQPPPPNVPPIETGPGVMSSMPAKLAERTEGPAHVDVADDGDETDLSSIHQIAEQLDRAAGEAAEEEDADTDGDVGSVGEDLGKFGS